MPRISLSIFKLLESSKRRLELIGVVVPFTAGKDAAGALNRSRELVGAVVGVSKDAAAAVCAATVGEALAKKLAFDTDPALLTASSIDIFADGALADDTAFTAVEPPSGLEGSIPVSIRIADFSVEAFCAAAAPCNAEGGSAEWSSVEDTPFVEPLLPDIKAAVFSVATTAAFLAKDGEAVEGESSSSIMVMVVAFPLGPVPGVRLTAEVSVAFAAGTIDSEAPAPLGLGELETASELGINLALL